MKRPLLLLLALSALLSPLRAQQAPQFSQYIFNEAYLNPAYVGYKKNLYAHLLYRAQWVGLEGAPQTGLFSLDGTLGDRLNLGLQAYSEHIGLMRNTSVTASYAFRMPLGERTTISFGLGLGGYYSSIDGGGFITTSGNPNPVLATGDYRHLSPDANVGVYLSSDRYYVGLSGANLISGYVGKPTQAGYQLPQQGASLYLSAGYLFYLSRDVRFKPSLLYRETFKNPSTLDLNGMFLLFGSRLWVGGSYRCSALLWKSSQYADQGVSSFSSSSVSAIAEIFLTNRIRLGYAYDYSFTAVGSYYSTHEVSLGFYLTPSVSKVYSPRYF